MLLHFLIIVDNGHQSVRQVLQSAPLILGLFGLRGVHQSTGRVALDVAVDIEEVPFLDRLLQVVLAPQVVQRVVQNL